MAVYLDEEEEKKRKEDREKFLRERDEAIEEARVNGKAKRQHGDSIFQLVFFGIIAIVMVVLIYRWVTGGI